MPAIRPTEAPLDRPIRLAVLISGGGTTLVNLLQQIAERRLRAEIPLVIASRPGVGGIEKARAAGLRCEVLPRRESAGIEAYSEAVFELIRNADVDLTIFGGFLNRLLIPDDFAFRVLNIHPGLIPAFCGEGYYGRHVHEAALARGVKVSGCTVHFADNEYDHGPIILQRCVPVLDDDTPDTLAARIFAAECEAYPDAIRLFAAGRLEIDGRRVRIRWS